MITAALQGRVRPQQRRRDEHRHQERHEPLQGQLLHARSATSSMNAQTETRDPVERAASRTTAATSTADRSAARSSRTRRTSSRRSSARSRTRSQTVNTLGLFPDQGRHLPDAVPREPLHGEGVDRTSPRRSSCRCATAGTPNSQVYGVGTRSVPENWGDSTNTFNSINLNHNWVLGGSKLNEFIFQYADFANYILARTGDPQQTFANGVVDRLQLNTPQTTIQHKFQFRDDFSWHMTRHGRPRPRLQDRRELHQRAEAVRHVQLGQRATTRTPTSTTTSNGPDQRRQPEQGRLRRRTCR